jgi:hypothetical protein
LAFVRALVQPRFFKDSKKPTTITNAKQTPPIEAEAEEDEGVEDEKKDVEEPDV